MSAGDRIVLLLQSVKGKRLVQELHGAANALRDILKAQLNHPGRSNKKMRRGGSPQYGPPDANGKRHKLPGAGREFHVVSAVGDSPAPDFTNLRESTSAIQTDVSGLRWQVGVHAPGASALENRMNRPYMKPATESWKDQAGKHFTAARKA